MASNRISDAYIPELESGYVQERSTTLSRLWQSGIVQNNASMASQMAASSGNSFVVPFNLSIEDDDTEVGDDNPATIQVPAKFGTNNYTSIVTNRTKAYSSMQLAGLLAGNNPREAVRSQLASFWANNNQKELLAQLVGVFADNDANDAGDMTHDIYSDVIVGSLTAANLISTSAVIEARHTMGDHRSALGAVIMHSIVRKQLEKDEPNSFIPASESQIGFDTYLGMVVIEDDSLTVTTGTNTDAYSTYLFGAGAFQYAVDSRMILPEEIEWVGESGNGMGEEIIRTRRRFQLHPQGFSYIPAVDTNEQATRALFQNAAQWDRVVANRKQIKVARLLSNAV